MALADMVGFPGPRGSSVACSPEGQGLRTLPLQDALVIPVLSRAANSSLCIDPGECMADTCRRDKAGAPPGDL